MTRGFLVRVDPGDGLPIYRQIVEQIKAAIAGGVLSAGDRLPSHRDLARDLVVAPLTISRAYDLLEREGFLSRERGKGAFVTAGPDAAPLAAEELSDRAHALVRQAQALGLSQQDALRALRKAWQEGRKSP